jgi:E1A/CREB-binding protein
MGSDAISLKDLEPEPLGDHDDTTDVEKVEKGGADQVSDPKDSEKKDDEESTKKRGFDDIEPAIARFAAANSNTTPIADTADEDEPQEIEMFESRQQFLNYCQTNHFQFDELRRAKHTTMMVLFQLHNPNAPKFIPQCGACYREISHGTRYHCNDCSNYDLCEDCYEPVITRKWADRDATKFTHPSSHSFATIDAEADVDVQKNSEERSRAIKAHLELLAHAASCDGSCSLNNCPRMKKLFEHVRTCKVNPKKSCKICSRILTLLTVHARTCNIRDGSCPLPYCDRIREKMHRRRQQQQLMDDRRRQAQNQLYRDGSNQE